MDTRYTKMVSSGKGINIKGIRESKRFKKYKRLKRFKRTSLEVTEVPVCSLMKVLIAKYVVLLNIEDVWGLRYNQ